MKRHPSFSLILCVGSVLFLLAFGEVNAVGFYVQRVPAPFTITIEGQSPYYQPVQPVVPQGVPVQWFNPTASPHTVTDDSCGRRRTCLFDSGLIGPNQQYTVPNLPPGRYPYHCELHPIMRGMVTITEGQRPQLTQWIDP